MATDPSQSSLRFSVKVKPGASSPRIERVQGTITICVTEKPVDDKANKAVIELLARRLGIAKSRIAIVGNPRGRQKQVEISNLTAAEMERKLHLI